MGEDLITRARKAGLVIAQLDRKEEPGRGKQRRELFFSGGVEEVLRKCKTMPDVIFDRGGMGKEPMIRVLGQDPEKVVDKIIRLA
jgi:hydroxymethylpyrimidine/phosphomethylpyrimidine kinase